jgi:Lrp/AsnC family leucine-responsive transcriptional regulator
MPSNPQTDLDATDVTILRLLQDDGRMKTADLAREIHMSPTATADRVRRLTEEGVIRRYSAVVDPVALGYPVMAFIRLRRAGSIERFHEFLERTPEIREAHNITGDDCCLMRVLSPSMEDLESLASELTAFGHVTTNIVFTNRALDRPLLPPE